MARVPPRKRRFPTRLVALVGGSLLLVALVSLINLSPNLSHLDARMASGTPEGNYHAIVDRLSAAAAAQEGHLANLSTDGSVDNIEQLEAAKDDCDLQFALAQDGVPGPPAHGLQLIARLPKSESVFILGKEASAVSEFADMRGMRVGVGPANSGTDYLARRIFEDEDYRPLGLILHNASFDEQLDMLDSGALDLAIFVLDEDATLIRTAIRERHLEIADLEHLDVIARKFSFVSHGRIAAGQFDPISVLPKTDRRVLRVDTLVLGNDCASRTETIALLSLLSDEFPNLLQHNRDEGGSSFFPTSKDARAYILNDGPEWADTHVPWLVNIMPLGNWFYVIMGVSILFNVMTSWHRFRLWRIDATRDKTQQVFRDVLGHQFTPAEILELAPSPEHATPENLRRIDEALSVMDGLRERCRDQENSMLVPMGQEWAYRYQEEQMELILTAMRDFRKRASALADEHASSSDAGDGNATDS